MLNRVELLINALLDTEAREDERDDAAMDLGLFDDDKALSALFQVASNPNEDKAILDSCGESIAQILVKREKYRKDLLDMLAPTAKSAAYSFIREAKPEWIAIEKNKTP